MFTDDHTEQSMLATEVTVICTAAAEASDETAGAPAAEAPETAPVRPDMSRHIVHRSPCIGNHLQKAC